MPRYIHRSDTDWLKYEIELDGTFMNKKEILEASEDGWIVKILHEGYSSDPYGTRPTSTRKVYGRVFIVRVES